MISCNYYTWLLYDPCMIHIFIVAYQIIPMVLKTLLLLLGNAVFCVPLVKMTNSDLKSSATPMSSEFLIK